MSRSVEVITTLLNDNDTSLFSSCYTTLTIKLYIEVIQHIQFIFSRNTSCALNNDKTRSIPPPQKKTKQNKKQKSYIYISIDTCISAILSKNKDLQNKHNGTTVST
jgi:hypothetical protein